MVTRQSSRALYGRAFAVTYLVSLPLALAGIIAAFATDASAWSISMAVVGIGLLVALANVIGDEDPDLGSCQLGWYHLISGAELRRCWSVVRGRSSERGEVDIAEGRNATARPKTR